MKEIKESQLREYFVKSVCVSYTMCIFFFVLAAYLYFHPCKAGQAVFFKHFGYKAIGSMFVACLSFKIQKSSKSLFNRNCSGDQSSKQEEQFPGGGLCPTLPVYATWAPLQALFFFWWGPYEQYFKGLSGAALL